MDAVLITPLKTLKGSVGDWENVEMWATASLWSLFKYTFGDIFTRVKLQDKQVNFMYN
jgi:hypothetical protein